jgi:hypothetical protein
MCIAYPSRLRRSLLPVFLSLALSACSGPMTPPESIDDETTVSAIEPVQSTASDTATYAATENTTQDASASAPADYLDTPNLAGRNAEQQGMDEQPMPKIDEEPVQQSAIPQDGVNMDNALGVGQPVGLAEEQANDIAEGETDQPVVDGIGTEALTERQPRRQPEQSRAIDFNDATQSNQVTLPSRRRDRESETEVAMLPRTSDPLAEAPPAAAMSAADIACRKDLRRMGVRFEELEPIEGRGSCGIAHPIKVTGLQGNIQIKPAATLNCPMTRLLAKWVKNELVPSSRLRYFSGVQTIHQMSSYSCRKMNSRSNNPWSEHAKGNALDIGGFTLKNGKHIDVRKKSFFAFREKGLLKTVREDSCKYFNTVLGPGDAHHGDHFHFDLRPRKSGYRHCSL